MKIDFTYRRPEERRKAEPKPNPPAGTYDAKIYNTRESEVFVKGSDQKKKVLYVNFDIETEYQYGKKFDILEEPRSKYDCDAFSELLDACGIGDNFDDTDILVGKIVEITLELKGNSLVTTKFQQPGNKEWQQDNYNYGGLPEYSDNSNQEPPF